MKYGGTLGMIASRLKLREMSLRQVSVWYGLNQQEAERLLRRLKAGRVVGGEGLYVSGYAWRDSAYGGRYAVPLYRYGRGQDVSLTQWQREQQQLQDIPALAEVARRVKSVKFKASPWDGLLRPVLEAC